MANGFLFFPTKILHIEFSYYNYFILEFRILILKSINYYIYIIVRLEVAGVAINIDYY